MSYPKLVENLIEQLSRLPGVGRRSAERMVFWFLNNSSEDARQMAEGIVRLKEGLSLCKECQNLSEDDTCLVCRNPARDRTMICVVEDHKHLLAFERTGIFRGVYHVLLGAINPSEGRGPDDLDLKPLLSRIARDGVKEVIIATDPDTEGEMTALHLAQELKPTGVRVTRIGLGIPVGSSVEYADASTLTMSMTCRRDVTEAHPH